MWKPEHRRGADRTGLRYPSDLSDAEWLIVEPMIPPAKGGGRRRSVNVREVLNGIFYVLWTGCQWQALPKDLPPKSTVHDYLELWNGDGTLERIHHELYMAVREQEGREPSPTVAIIDSQTAKGSQKGGSSLDPSGYDAGKKIKGRKRHILVDTLGLLLNVVVHPADVQDRDGARLVLDRRTRPSSSASSPMPAIRDHAPRKRLPAPVVGCSRSSSATNCTNSSSCLSAGSSNEPWHVSAAIAAWRAISSDTPAPPLPSSGWP